MKKIFLLALLAFTINAFSQNYIEYKSTGIKITADALDNINNECRYTLEIPANMIDTAIVLLPSINGKTKYVGGKFYYTAVAPLPSLWAALETYKVELTDVGYTGREIISNFSCTLLYNINPLNLNDNWILKD